MKDEGRDNLGLGQVVGRLLGILQQVFFVLVGVFVGLWISGQVCNHLL